MLLLYLTFDKLSKLMMKVITLMNYIYIFKVGSMPSMEPNVGLELTTLRSRLELRSRVGHVTY